MHDIENERNLKNAIEAGHQMAARPIKILKDGTTKEQFIMNAWRGMKLGDKFQVHLDAVEKCLEGEEDFASQKFLRECRRYPDSIFLYHDMGCMCGSKGFLLKRGKEKDWRYAVWRS